MNTYHVKVKDASDDIIKPEWKTGREEKWAVIHEYTIMSYHDTEGEALNERNLIVTVTNASNQIQRYANNVFAMLSTEEYEYMKKYYGHSMEIEL